MSIAEPILLELEQEAGATRRVLERVPEDAFSWKPHEKSMSMAQLASHLAEIPKWAEAVMNLDEMVFDPAYQPFVATSKEQLLHRFDENVAAARESMAGQSDERMIGTWSLKAGEEVLLAMTRAAVIRSMILNHAVHHRGQLTVYLRLNDVPVPAVYGPSADEGA